MVMNLLSRTALAVSLFCVGVTACGGDDNKNNPTPDARPDGSVAIDAPPADSCLATTIPTDYDLASSDAMNQLWRGPITGDLGGVTQNVQFEFYGGAGTSGAVDLTAGDNANYKTCSQCVRVLTFDSAGAVLKQFFQTAGTITFTEDPFTNKKLVAATTAIKLVEVTIAMDFTSTPVPGGACLTLPATNINADRAPAAYTCNAATYGDGATCNCACGAHDPDCDTVSVVAGCTGTQVCGPTDTCADACNVFANPAVPCPTATNTCGYSSSTQDLCYSNPAVTDPALVGAACAPAGNALFCAVTNTISGGLCDAGLSGGQGDHKCRKVCDSNADCGNNADCNFLTGTLGAGTVKGMCEAKTNAADTCLTAPTITLNTPITATNVGAANNYNAGLEGTACTNLPQAGRDVAYQITLTAGQSITAKLTNVTSAYDPSLAIVGPGTAATSCLPDPAPITQCVAGSDAGAEGEDETVPFTATTAGTYFIIIDSFYAADKKFPTGTFTLTVN